MNKPRIRRTARVILFAEDDSRVLLFRHRDETPLDPLRPELLEYWAVPGGGLEEGETWEEAAVRELKEETGLEIGLGALVAKRQRSLVIQDEPVEMDERYFVSRTSATALDLSGRSPEEMNYLTDYWWWPLDELRCTPEIILPQGLAELIGSLGQDTPGEVVELEG